MSEDERDNKLEKLELNYEELEKAGRKLQEIGSEIVSGAASGKKQVQFLRSEFPKYDNISSSYPELKDYLDADNRWISIAIDETQQALHDIPHAGNFATRALSYFGTSASTVATVGSGAIIGMAILENKNPDIDFKKTYNLQPPQFFLDKIDSNKIADLLSSYDPEFEALRQGAWKTFYSVSDAKLSQAAHTMRDLLRSFISKHASNDDVKKSVWWTYDSNTKDGVSNTHRIRYLIYGPTAYYDSENITFIKNQVDQFEKDFKFLNKVAHGSKSADIAVEASMKSIEQLILLILQHRRRAEEG